MKLRKIKVVDKALYLNYGLHTFGVVRKKLQTIYIYTELILRRSKVQEMNMSCERILNFDQ